jgi:hypothetical protein
MRMRQFLVSLAGFALLLAIVVSVDERVRDEFDRIIWGGNGITSWDNRAISYWNSTTSGLRYAGLENGPLLAFAVAGGVLFVFMMRT